MARHKEQENLAGKKWQDRKSQRTRQEKWQDTKSKKPWQVKNGKTERARKLGRKKMARQKEQD